MNKIMEELIEWIEKNPTAFQVIETAGKELTEQGAEELSEQEDWRLTRGKTYFATRNGSALIAFYIPKGAADHYQLVASHNDSPSFRIKEIPQMMVENRYVRLNVEGYGGMIDSSWFDRPLSIAGRMMVKKDERIEAVHYDAGRDLCLIPNLAIHMNREINSGYKYNHQTDMLPLFGMVQEGRDLYTVLCEGTQMEPGQIVAADLYLYNRQRGCIWGADREFVSAPRLDDQQCVFGSMRAFSAACKKRMLEEKETDEHCGIPVLCIFDNEEVGSQTKQGADSTFLADTLERIGEAMGNTPGRNRQMIARSFLISADNAHALHPNHTEKADPTNRPAMNGGIVIKYNASQKYTTDSFSAAVMKQVCEKAGVPYQTFFNRSDMAGGSTLGNISISHVSLHSADIGLAQLAMHSAYETAGVQDTAYLIRALEEFYKGDIQISERGFFV